MDFVRDTVLLLAGSAFLFAQESAVDQAWDLLARDKRPEAMALLRTEVKQHPQNADARLLLGSLLSETGEPAEGIAHLREGVRLRPRSAMARNALAEVLIDVGDMQAARHELEKAVTLDPKLAQARQNLGVVLLQAEDFPAAATQLERAIQLFGQKKEGSYARYLRAKAHAASGALNEAEMELQRAVALNPKLAEAWSDLGNVREKLGNDKGALTALQRSVELNPDGAIARTRLGTLYLRLDQPENAVAHLERAVQLMPDDQTALNGLQRALREAGQTEKADQVRSRLAAVFRKRDQDSQNALAAVNLNNEGAEMEKQGNLAAAVEKYRSALNLNPGHAGMRANYAIALLRLGRWQQGLEELRTAIRQDPSNQKFQKALEDALAQAPAQFRTLGSH